MNKQKFLDNLKDGQVAAVQNRAELNMLPESDFQLFDSSLPITEHTLTTDYFYEQWSKLNRANFAKQRCEHLINVKEKMQEMGVKGFVVSKQNQEIIKEVSQFNQAMQARLAKFKPTADFQAAIEQRDVDLVRAFISRDLNSEYLDASDVEDLVWYTQKMLPETFESYETDTKFRKPFNEDESVWNTDYFIHQLSPLNANFALERVLHLIIVRDFLRKQGVPEFQKLVSSSMSAEPEEKTTSSEKYTQKTESKQPKNSEKTHSDRSHSPLKAALIVGGGILALVALAIAILK